MQDNKGPVVLRTNCGCSRRVWIDKDLNEWRMALMPYQKAASIVYYTTQAPAGTGHRVFKDTGEKVWDAFDLPARVFIEVETTPAAEAQA